MTTLATALALIPLVVLGQIPGHEIEHPMAVVILGGLVTSTLVNLFVVPAFVPSNPTEAGNDIACRRQPRQCERVASRGRRGGRRGARAWLNKLGHTGQLAQVIRGVCQGEYWIPPDVLGYVLRQFVSGVSAPRQDLLGLLTARERDVLQCAVDEMQNRQIARRLFLSPNTVRTHTRNMLHKLDAFDGRGGDHRPA